MRTQKVEFLMAQEDHTWDTETVDVPTRLGHDREKVLLWAEKYLAGQAQYRKVVMWGLYSFPSQED